MCCSRQSRYHERSLIASSLLVLALTLRAESLQKGPEYKKNQSESSIDNVGKMIASLKGSAIVGPFGGGEPYRFEGRPDIGYMLMDAAADNFQVHGVLKESSEGPQTAGEQLLYLDAISFLFGGGEIVVKPGKTDSIQVFVDGVRLGGAKHEDAKMYRWLRTSSGTVHLSLQAYVENYGTLLRIMTEGVDLNVWVIPATNQSSKEGGSGPYLCLEIRLKVVPTAQPQGILGETFQMAGGAPSSGPPKKGAGQRVFPLHNEQHYQVNGTPGDERWTRRRLLGSAPNRVLRRRLPRLPYSENQVFKFVNMNRFDDVAPMV